jgi:hypothetical protein
MNARPRIAALKFLSFRDLQLCIDNVGNQCIASIHSKYLRTFTVVGLQNHLNSAIGAVYLYFGNLSCRRIGRLNGEYNPGSATDDATKSKMPFHVHSSLSFETGQKLIRLNISQYSAVPARHTFAATDVVGKRMRSEFSQVNTVS